MMPNADEIATSMHDALYALSGMIAIAGVFAGLIKREPLTLVGGFIPFVIVLLVLKNWLIAVLVIVPLLMIIAYFVYLLSKSEPEPDGGLEDQRNDPPTIGTLRERQQQGNTSEPVIVSSSAAAATRVLDDGADAVQPGKRKVILD